MNDFVASRHTGIGRESPIRAASHTPPWYRLCGRAGAELAVRPGPWLRASTRILSASTRVLQAGNRAQLRASNRSHALAWVLLLALAGVPTLRAQGPGGGMHGGPGGPGGMNGPGGFGGPGAPGMGHNPPPGGGNGSRTGTSPTSRLPGPAGRWWDNSSYAHSVGLTTEQQRRMDSVFQENRSALVSGLDTLQKAQSRLNALSATGKPSEPALLSEIQNVAQARADLDKTYTHMTLQIRHEMTDDQISKFEKLK